MIKPRHTETWGERLRVRRAQNYLISSPEFSSLSVEEKCAHHLNHVGEVQPYNVSKASQFWCDTLDQECSDCPYNSTCRLFIREE